MNRNTFRIGDRVSFNGAYIGTVDYHLSNGRILVKEVIGLSRAWYPEQLQLAAGQHADERGATRSLPDEDTCPTLQKLQDALDCIDSMIGPRCSKRLLRVKDLIASAAADFFSSPDD